MIVSYEFIKASLKSNAHSEVRALLTRECRTFASRTTESYWHNEHCYHCRTKVYLSIICFRLDLLQYLIDIEYFVVQEKIYECKISFKGPMLD